jgi:hypothetical protein
VAEIVETFVATWSDEIALTPKEMARLRETDKEPFGQADPVEVEAFLRRRG